MKVLRKGVGGWSAGTEVEIEHHDTLNKTILVRPFGGDPYKDALEVPEDYVLTRRPKDGLTKMTRRTEEPVAE